MQASQDFWVPVLRVETDKGSEGMKLSCMYQMVQASA